jgi:dTDP-4-amino-4,6-dideoxygalactose transaminase
VLNAISRYGARVIPNTEQTIAALRGRRQLVQGPHIDHFERTFAQRLGARHAISASYGRVAFSYLLEAMDFPPGSEIIIPALTFWVVPELARVGGLTPVFADVNPDTFTLDPDAFERAITPRTRAVVPTHLYGQPCDMDRILEIARRHNLMVIEDCAHALGATWQGQPVGTFGDAAFFSFQLLKPLNAYGGGMAVTGNDKLAARVRALADDEPWPTEQAVRKRLRLGQVQRISIRPRVFTWSLFPVLWASSYVRLNPDVYLWEKIRPLSPMPASYRQRFSNVQAAIALEALKYLDEWTTRTVANAMLMNEALRGAAVRTPTVLPGSGHVYYQYAIYTDRRDQVIRRCIRRGIDVETLHVDVCTRLPLFGIDHAPAPGAERTAAAIQLPVHASMTSADLRRVAAVVRDAVGG